MSLVAQSHKYARAGLWSIVALVPAGAGVVASTWLIVGSDGDPSQVLWPLVVLPVGIALAPVIVPRDRVRLLAAVGMGAWCIATGLSIGVLLVPALGALLGAAIREGES